MFGTLTLYFCFWHGRFKCIDLSFPLMGKRCYAIIANLSWRICLLNLKKINLWKHKIYFLGIYVTKPVINEFQSICQVWNSHFLNLILTLSLSISKHFFIPPPHTPFFQLFSKEVFSLLFKNKSWGRRGHGNWQAVLDTPLCDKVCQWLAAGQWFSPDIPPPIKLTATTYLKYCWKWC